LTNTSAPALANAMAAYFDRGQWERQSHAARALAERYPIEKSYEQMTALYHEITVEKLQASGNSV
jgi:hypothetical protein